MWIKIITRSESSSLFFDALKTWMINGSSRPEISKLAIALGEYVKFADELMKSGGVVWEQMHSRLVTCERVYFAICTSHPVHSHGILNFACLFYQTISCNRCRLRTYRHNNDEITATLTTSIGKHCRYSAINFRLSGKRSFFISLEGINYET